MQAELKVLQAHGLKIGERVDIFSEYPFDSLYPGLISVGNDVTISANVKILAHDASMGYLANGMVKIGEVIIGNHVFIGYGSIILCNVHIGDYAVIGAGSVVTHDVPAHSVYAGNPAHFIKTTEILKKELEEKRKTHASIEKPWQEIRQLDESGFGELKNQLNGTYGYIIHPQN